MRVVVPFAADDPKTRLADVLDPEERIALSRAMLRDVLDAVSEAGGDPTVLATAPVDVEVEVVVDERSLTEAVNGVLADADEPIAIVMADLGLATADAIERLFDAPGDVVLAPGRGGGTNAIVARHPDFRVDYHGTSYLDHLDIAREISARVSEVDSHRLTTDVDEPADLVELRLYGEGRARSWLDDAGFRVRVEGGRAELRRES